MPDDLDRALARLAVEHGFLPREEGARFWQQIQAPGSPRFVQVLVQTGRLKPADIDRLRALWQQQSGGAPAAAPPVVATAVAPPPASRPATAALARPPGGPGTGAHARPSAAGAAP